MHESGLLISIEGIDGSGKTTQIPLVVKELLERGVQVQYTQEPTRERLGLVLRDYLRDPTSIPEVDTLLFAADRVEHYWNIMKPLLDKDFIVITDRYVASSIAYQGSMGVDLDWIRTVNGKVPLPDHTIYLEIDVELALQRLMTASRHAIEKFEKLEHMKKVRNIYNRLNFPNTHVLDGSLTISEVTSNIVNKIFEISEL